MLLNETTIPACAVTVKVANWFAATAAPSFAEVQLFPPQARAAPEPLVVPTPIPRVSEPTVTLAPTVSGGSGDVPKLLAPPGCPLTSQAASVAAVARAAGAAISSSSAAAKAKRR